VKYTSEYKECIRIQKSLKEKDRNKETTGLVEWLKW
jgi:hypothetical protein